MATVRFTDNIQRHVRCPVESYGGDTVRKVLDAYFSAHPDARTYVLDEHGALRQHMVIFVDSRQIGDRATLSDAVADDATIDVMQALSGG